MFTDAEAGGCGRNETVPFEESIPIILPISGSEGQNDGVRMMVGS